MSDVLSWPIKGPDEILNYSLDVTALLDISGITLIDASVAIAPHGAGEMTATQLIVNGGVITVGLSGGIPGRNYEVAIGATADDGRTKEEWLIRVDIDPMLSIFPLIKPESEDFGVELTWP